MHYSVTLSATFLLALSHLSTALPRVQDSQLFARVPQSDGARDGCHPQDYIATCERIPLHSHVNVNEATEQLTNSCSSTCWPALIGKSSASWDPRGCLVSCFPMSALMMQTR